MECTECTPRMHVWCSFGLFGQRLRDQGFPSKCLQPSIYRARLERGVWSGSSVFAGTTHASPTFRWLTLQQA